MLNVAIHSEYSTNCISTVEVSKCMYSRTDNASVNKDTISDINLTDSHSRSPAHKTTTPPSMGAQTNKLSSGRV